jgi:hypothetical protein
MKVGENQLLCLERKGVFELVADWVGRARNGKEGWDEHVPPIDRRNRRKCVVVKKGTSCL